MNYTDPRLIEALAAEYALGTLAGRARRRFEALRMVREDVDRETSWWEQAFAEMASRIEPVTPPKKAFRRIEAQLDRGRPSRFGARFAGVAAAAVVALVILLLPLQVSEEPGRVAVIQSEEQQPLWRVRVGEKMEILQVEAPELAPDRDYELWLLTDAGPVSMGLMPESGVARRPLDASLRKQLSRHQAIAVSIEPAGGSPTGSPTGPVVHKARFVTL